MSLEFPPHGAEWTFFVVAVVILAGPALARVLRLPGMVGLVLGGMAVGPNVLDWVPREGIVQGVGQLGLLLLMFLAGLELDLEEFARGRNAAIRFGLLTFTIPLVLGAVVGGAFFDYGLATAILFGSLWASHTLVSYPIARARGLSGHPGVGMAVSGTVITDTLALFVLAVVVGAETGDGSSAAIVAGLVIALAVLAAVAFIGVPRLVARFFAGAGQDRGMRFIGVVATFTGVAVLADLGGLEGIVGAFFAGLAVNRLIPNRGPLMERLEFFGSSLLVPMFLISTGMLIDPAEFAKAETLALGGAALLVVVVGKGLAAALGGRSLRLTPAGIALVFSLTVAQAAATLAAVIVGLEAGLFDETLVNAALVVVLASLVIASVGTAFAAERVPAALPAGGHRLGEAVLLPVADDVADRRPVIAALMARHQKGVVIPVSILAGTADPERRAAARARLDRVRAVIAEMGVETEGGVRVADSVPAGALNAAAEAEATCILVSWAGATRARSALFGDAGAALRSRSTVPVLVVASGAAVPTGVVLALSADDLRPERYGEVALAGRTAQVLAAALGTEARILAPEQPAERPVLVGLERAPVEGYAGGRMTAVAGQAGPADIVVIPGGMSRSALGGDAAALVARTDGPTVVVTATPGASGGDVPVGRVLAGETA